MADSDSDASVRFDSWVSYYAANAKNPAGSLQVLAKSELSILDPLPRDYANDTNKFKSCVASYPDGNFLALPAGGNSVRIIHHCFVHGDPGQQPTVVGILGTRRTSPFKTVNSIQAVALITKPRSTRGGGNNISFLPSIEEFMNCDVADDFGNLTPEGKKFPASNLWSKAQSFWLHPAIFEIADGNSPHRAADLALTVIREISGSLAADDESDTDSREKEVYNLLLFLWAVEKSCTTKVTLGDPPSLELFDIRCQGILNTLSPRRSRSRTASKKNSPPPPKSQDENDRNYDRRKNRKSKSKSSRSTSPSDPRSTSRTRSHSRSRSHSR
jgi:hypothetical protein